MVAVNGDASSAPSPILHYQQPACEIYAEVIFDSFIFTAIDDGLRIAATADGCMEADLFFQLSVDMKKRFFGSEDLDWPRSCGTHLFKNFQQHGGDPPSTGGSHIYYIPIDPGHTQFHIMANFQDNDENEYIFFDDIDELCISGIVVKYAYDQWPDVDVTYTIPCPDSNIPYPELYDARGSVIVRVRGVSGPAGP